MALLSAWTVQDKERLRGLILHHLSIGGSVMDACQQFQFETNNRHTAKRARLRWLLQLRWTRKERSVPDKTPKHTQDGHSLPSRDVSTRDSSSHDVSLGDSTSAVQNSAMTQEDSLMSTYSNYGNDESSARLLNAVSQILEDRQRLKDDTQEHQKLTELSQRKVKELESSNQDLEAKLAEKDVEAEEHERRLVDTQYKLQQMQEDYNQLVETRNNEYERLQAQIAELQSKYDALGSDYSKLRRESTAQIESLENTVRNAEAKNAKLAAEAEDVRKENVALTRRVTDFAQQIAGALGTVQAEAPAVTPVPIRPTIAKAADK